MSERPSIKPGDWLRVENVDCVVCLVRPPGDPAGDCEVVFNPGKPTNLDVAWSGEAWKFVDSGDFGGYAGKSARLAPFVATLKRGR